jgi:hypothetical protein
MSPKRRLVVSLLASLILAPPADSADPPRATKVLADRLRATGRAEAEVTQSLPGDATAHRGTLALEPPDRVRLDFPKTGERLTVRTDGGEWLQPAAKQLLVLRPEHAAEAARAWSIFLDGERSAYAESGRGPRRSALIPREPGGPIDSVVVSLDAAGLPARLEAFTAGERLVYTFQSWRFTRPKGSTAFTLRAPAGYGIIELP